MIHIIYHASDFDGKFSGLIARLALSNFQEPIQMIPMDHEYKKDFNYKEIGKEDSVFLLDFSFDVDVMQWLQENVSNFIWIDHHISAINNCKHLAIKGLRDLNASAAMLCLRYFFAECPENSSFRDMINLISIHDIWDEESDLWELAELFQHGLKLAEWDARDNLTFQLIQNLFNSPKKAENFLYRTVEEGKIVSKYKKIANKQLAERTAFPCMFQNYKAIVINGSGNSQLFDSIDLTPYELRIVYFFNGRDYVFSLYQGNPEDDVDCSVIAKRNGGGGHKGAAGFEKPFMEIIKNENGLELIVK